MDIYAQRYSSDGTVLKSNFRVTNTGDGSQRYPDVKLWKNRIYNTWEDNRASGTGVDIWANVLDWENPVGIGDDGLYQITLTFVLHQNYPNPFNPTTTIRFAIPREENVLVEVYNTAGQRVTTLVNTRLNSGFHEVIWNASGMSTGIYFYKIKAGQFQDLKKMILIK